MADLKEKNRIYWLDNLRGILIICVVFGHVITSILIPNRDFWYNLLYLFHMPAMVFLSGICAKDTFDAKRIIKKIVVPYIIFQIIYSLIDFFITGSVSAEIFHTPKWIMWYMFSLMAWSFLIHLFKTESKKRKAIFLSLSIILSLVAGCFDFIGNKWALSRTIVLFPFFLLGFFLKENEKIRERKITNKEKIVAAISGVCICVAYIVFSGKISRQWLYHNVSYKTGDYTIWIRLSIIMMAAICIYVLCIWTPNKKIPYLTYLGKNTLSVYLLHGIIIKIIKQNHLWFNQFNAIITTVIFTVLIILAFANPITEKLFKGKRRETSKENENITNC